MRCGCIVDVCTLCELLLGKHLCHAMGQKNNSAVMLLSLILPLNLDDKVICARMLLC